MFTVRTAMLCAALMGGSLMSASVSAKVVKSAKNSFESSNTSSLPDTPSGKRLKEWLNAVKSGNSSTLKQFVEDDYLPRPGRMPADEAAFLAENFGDFAARYPVRLIESGEYQTSIIGEAALQEQWIKLTMIVSKEPPHLIEGVTMEPVETPADLRDAKRKPDREIVSTLKGYTAKLVAANRFSGVVLLAKGDTILSEDAYGQADNTRKLPNHTDTRFGLASMGKMFTAIAIAQLVEAGKLHYEDTLARVLPDYPNRAAAEKITIRHLLTHTSGMGDFFDKTGMEAAAPTMKKPSDWFRIFADDPLQFEPGKDWAYSNAGFIVLGAVVEKVSGESFYSYVREHVFQVAGMKNTAHNETGGDVANQAIPYLRGPGGEWKVSTIKDVGGPAGGGYSTVEDLRRFALAIRSGKLVSRNTADLITTGKVEAGFGPNNATRKSEYGYGFEVDVLNGHRSFGHGGGFLGVCTRMDVYPDEGYVLVVLSNYDPPAGGWIADRLREMLSVK